MGVRETHFVVWGVKVPYIDYEDHEELLDEYEASPYKKGRSMPEDKRWTGNNHPKEGIALVSSGMDSDWYVIGFVKDMANASDGEGLDFNSLGVAPTNAEEVIYKVNQMCERFGIEKPKSDDFGWKVFTQYS